MIYDFLIPAIGGVALVGAILSAIRISRGPVYYVGFVGPAKRADHPVRPEVPIFGSDEECLPESGKRLTQLDDTMTWDEPYHLGRDREQGRISLEEVKSFLASRPQKILGTSTYRIFSLVRDEGARWPLISEDEDVSQMALYEKRLAKLEKRMRELEEKAFAAEEHAPGAIMQKPNPQLLN